MRLTIPAAILAALTVWPSSAGALDLDTIILCGGRVMASGIVDYKNENDVSLLRGPYLIINVAGYASLKDSNGRTPNDDEYGAFIDAVFEETKDFGDRYNGRRKRWDSTAHEEIVRCYDALSYFALTDGVAILGTEDLFLARLHAGMQIQDIREALSE